VGGAGDDIYIVDTTTDTITEAASSGNDLVRSTALTHTLAVNVENLELWGSSAINGTGNTLANMLTGNSAANVLDGGTGIDTLLGGSGDDTYIVDSTTDAIRDDNNGGTDTVKSSVNYVIPTTYQYTVNGTLTYSGSTYIENLTLTGAVATTGTGNTLNNVLTGNGINNTLKGLAGNDTLEGAGGVDTLEGGVGDDIYIVDTTTDVITELAGEGTDTVQSSVTFTLAALANVENVTLTGTGANSATGNASANALRGNSAANTLTGGAGNDTYLFGRGGAADTVVDTDSTAGNADLLLLDAGIAYDQLWFKHVGSGLEVSVIGTNDKVTVSNWYGGTNNQVEKIQVSDGLYLVNTQVEALVQAMAAMTPPPLGQTELTAAEHLQLDSVFATTWQVA
jgi:Ca2+-binding RTX toxin-like protein